MLTPYEIGLLRRSKKEMAQIVHEVRENKGDVAGRKARLRTDRGS